MSLPPAGGDLLFIEPFQQGYGDLIFQTPIFEALKRKGFRVHVYLKKEHLPIIKINPHIEHIYFRGSFSDLGMIIRKKFSVVCFLTRDTVAETLLGLLKSRSHLVPLDGDLIFWNSQFSKNHTLAWQSIFRRYISTSLNFNRPEIYINLPEKHNSLKKRVCIIAGVEKEDKAILNLSEIIESMENKYEIVLLGKDPSWVRVKGKSIDLVNQKTYEDTIKEIAMANLVIGPEGSLVHVSTTLRIPTIVLEDPSRPFYKYCSLKNEDNIKVIDRSSLISTIKSLI